MSANIQQWTVEKPWLETHCLLGEGPFYEESTGNLRFVDIRNKRLHYVKMAEGPSSLKTIQLDVCPTVTANIAGVDPQERIAIGVKYGLAVLDVKKETYELIQPFEQPANERLRSNDGGVDPLGRFWLGTMTDFGLGPFKPEGNPTLPKAKRCTNTRTLSIYSTLHLLFFKSDMLDLGAVYLMDAKSREVKLPNMTIPNTPGWSPDGKTLYVTHSNAREIYAFDFDTESGEISNKRVFYNHDGSGEPDGFRVDVDGFLWQAVYGEGRVIRIDPNTTKIVGEVKVPTNNTTCVHFVGTELVITTAEDDEGEGSSRENGGHVFKVDVGIRGMRLNDFKL
ncbi:Regucalcin [Fusarium oxysporum f. sp. cubense]|uniref:Regucalcin n=1 Tax=Fusarium oxysporum f. sp. cubense TaxID=61366 RepID=A0A559LV89_FUSOC|nr:Regucalcin [Fusarium oxysporum f. sp. cubense]